MPVLAKGYVLVSHRAGGEGRGKKLQCCLYPTFDPTQNYVSLQEDVAMPFFCPPLASGTRITAAFSKWSVQRLDLSETQMQIEIRCCFFVVVVLVFKNTNASSFFFSFFFGGAVLFRPSNIAWHCTSARQCQTPCSTPHHTVPRQQQLRPDSPLAFHVPRLEPKQTHLERVGETCSRQSERRSKFA